MPYYLEIARLRSLNYSQRKIASTIHCRRDSVSGVFKTMDAYQLTYEKMKNIPTEQLEDLFNPRAKSKTVYAQPDYEALSKELVAPGMTVKQLWKEYSDSCLLQHQVPYQHTQFELYFSKYLAENNYSEIIQHKAGERCELDWVGDRPSWTDPETGEIIKGYIFVGVLTFSDYGYAEATSDMKESTWIRCVEHMFEYFGGVTPLTVIDNLKTGVISHPWGDEAVLNKSFTAMADYYGTSIFAGKVKSPHAKPSVESFVRMIERTMFKMRNYQFFSPEDYNIQLRKELDEINTNPFTNKSGSRAELFDKFEKPLLLTLPSKPYEPFEYAKAKVNNNYHVSHGRNYYSVPYKMCKIGDTVTLRIYPDRIEIFDKDDKQQFCVHRRFRKNQIGQYDTDPAHMPPSRTGDWNKERFLRWSWTLGPNVHELVQQIFNGGRPEQVYYDKVHAILKIADTTEAAKLDRACRRCIDKSINPTTRNIKALIEADVKEEELKAKKNADENAWLRGDSYYAEKKQ